MYNYYKTPYGTTRRTKRMTVKWSNALSYEKRLAYRIPSSAGVYEILLFKAGQYERAYVGEAGNLQRRFRDHLSPNEPNACVRRAVKKQNARFRCARIRNEDDRKDAEMGLYDKHNHRCNDRRPAGSGRYDSVNIVEL